MAVTITVDLGTSIVPLPLFDQAIAFAVSYDDRNQDKAVISVRCYTEADRTAGHTPAKVFALLNSEQPGIWAETYSNLSSLLNLDPTTNDAKFIKLPIQYVRDTFSWEIASESIADILNRLGSMRITTLTPEVVAEFSKVSEALTRPAKTTK